MRFGKGVEGIGLEEAAWGLDGEKPEEKPAEGASAGSPRARLTPVRATTLEFDVCWA